MKISFKEVLSKSEPLYNELLNSITPEICRTMNPDEGLDVKLIVNGIECNPKLLSKLIYNITTYVDLEAKKIAREKFHDVDVKVNQLIETITNAKDSIMDYHNLTGY